jgi:Homing endonuclease associated repeat/Sigma-70, region 4
MFDGRHSQRVGVGCHSNPGSTGRAKPIRIVYPGRMGSENGGGDRVREMYELYECGLTLHEVGEDFGLSRERVRQLFGRARLRTRSLLETVELKRAADLGRADEIIEVFRRTKDLAVVAGELEIGRATIVEVLRAKLPPRERMALNRKPGPAAAKWRYSNEELIAFLGEAGAALGGTLSQKAYDAFARGRRTSDGRPWPTQQTAGKRFGSWRCAVQAAGLDAYPSSGIGLRERFSREQCVDAVRLVDERLERCPSSNEYECCARESAELPSLATLRVRCGSWSEAVRLAGL